MIYKAIALSFIALLGIALSVLAQDSEGPNNQELVRQVMGDDVPDLNKIWNISSLNDDQKERLTDLYTNFNSEVKPLEDELKSIQQSITGGTNPSPEQMAQAQRQLATNPSLASGGGSPSMSRVMELKEQVKSKREALWGDIQGVLTTDQIDEAKNF